MLSSNGYYDGQELILLDGSHPKPNQKVVITLLDDFVSARPEKPYRKYVGKLSPESTKEIMDALKDCDTVDRDEW